MLRIAQSTAFERTRNALEDEAYAELRMAEDYRDFCDLLGGILDGFSGSHWVKNPASLELLSKLQSTTSDAFDEADTRVDRAKRAVETVDDDALSMARERDDE